MQFKEGLIILTEDQIQTLLKGERIYYDCNQKVVRFEQNSKSGITQQEQTEQTQINKPLPSQLPPQPSPSPPPQEPPPQEPNQQKPFQPQEPSAPKTEPQHSSCDGTCLRQHHQNPSIQHPSIIPNTGTTNVIINQTVPNNNIPQNDPYLMFFVTLPGVMSAYIFFYLCCIIIQYIFCGAVQASQLWISGFVLLIVATALIKVTQKYRQVYFLFASMFFITLQQILEIAAFAIAVSHPPVLTLSYGSYEYSYSQSVGHCSLFSDASGLSSDNLKYNDGLQYGCLAVYCIQFLLSFVVFYNFGRKCWDWQKYLKEAAKNPYQVPNAQQNTNQNANPNPV